jgi:hypothetical protein
LILRPLALYAPEIQRHFNNWNIVKNLATVVPWPYLDDGAETYVKRELGKIAAGEEIYQPKSRSWKQVGYGYRFVVSWKFRKIANCEAVQFW